MHTSKTLQNLHARVRAHEAIMKDPTTPDASYLLSAMALRKATIKVARLEAGIPALIHYGVLGDDLEFVLARDGFYEQISPEEAEDFLFSNDPLSPAYIKAESQYMESLGESFDVDTVKENLRTLYRISQMLPKEALRQTITNRSNEIAIKEAKPTVHVIGEDYIVHSAASAAQLIREQDSESAYVTTEHFEEHHSDQVYPAVLHLDRVGYDESLIWELATVDEYRERLIGELGAFDTALAQ